MLTTPFILYKYLFNHWTEVELKGNINYQNYLNGCTHHKQKYVHIRDTFASIEYRPGNT